VQKINQNEKHAYKTLVSCCKKERKGITVAGITAKTALPLEKVRELLPVCADEFGARLKVTESGEILYSFPKGFSSRYNGVRAVFGRFFDKSLDIIKTVLMNLFKVWILVMLVGYFVLFLLIALAALTLSVVAQSQSKNNDRRDSGGGFIVVTHILDLFIRIWFYSELTKSFDRRYGTAERKPKGRPLYKAVFSFVFGDGDPNAGIEQREAKAALAYIQAADGVISLPEYMILTGKSPSEAEADITGFCAAYGGSPEATEDGAVVYRFENLLLDTKLSASKTLYNGPLRRLRAFSSNEKKFNFWFSVLNGVNLLFGGYFLFNALSMGVITNIKTALQEAYLYSFVYHILEQLFKIQPLPVLFWGLGFVPLAFSVFFWGIPLIRKLLLDGKNQKLKFANLRQAAFDIVWRSPRNVKAESLRAAGVENNPAPLEKAQDRLIKELGAYTNVEVTAGDNGEFYYSFDGLEHEKQSLERYRKQILNSGNTLGGVVFDTDNA
jgi:hypothetical protein